MVQATCSIEGCENTALARTWCSKHYMRWQTHGDPLTYLVPSERDRIMAKVDVRGADECWPWRGALIAGGYGRTTYCGKQTTAHRAVYQLLVAPVPAELVVDHICHDPATCQDGSDCPHRRCVNPRHLEPKTNAENVSRNTWAAQTHCAHGHEFTANNTYVYDGHRSCRACAFERMRMIRSRENDPTT